ncbi:hypothetical protein NEIELOOT_01067 [Neisseria elongata subsp. glycolytica ATCC 29315]|uniref:Uncharacterized protein n=1 Tax=Neisseria elongata subsp. glycolytica ATCC 29315 TaxID=546263 RepID=D4DPT0_NEIEG|nr:hypothetical protein NEIELOOT_01067 [Neisseria elongata subsp. glycolytica ATCC 29315]
MRRGRLKNRFRIAEARFRRPFQIGHILYNPPLSHSKGRLK